MTSEQRHSEGKTACKGGVARCLVFICSKRRCHAGRTSVPAQVDAGGESAMLWPCLTLSLPLWINLIQGEPSAHCKAATKAFLWGHTPEGAQRVTSQAPRASLCPCVPGQLGEGVSCLMETLERLDKKCQEIMIQGPETPTLQAKPRFYGTRSTLFLPLPRARQEIPPPGHGPAASLGSGTRHVRSWLSAGRG